MLELLVIYNYMQKHIVKIELRVTIECYMYTSQV
jgi:hypothetical protein